MRKFGRLLTRKAANPEGCYSSSQSDYASCINPLKLPLWRANFHFETCSILLMDRQTIKECLKMVEKYEYVYQQLRNPIRATIFISAPVLSARQVIESVELVLKISDFVQN